MERQARGKLILNSLRLVTERVTSCDTTQTMTSKVWASLSGRNALGPETKRTWMQKWPRISLAMRGST